MARSSVDEQQGRQHASGAKRRSKRSKRSRSNVVDQPELAREEEQRLIQWYRDRRLGVYSIWIDRRGSERGSTLGTEMRRTPSVYLAVTASSRMGVGNLTLRLNAPLKRSLSQVVGWSWRAGSATAVSADSLAGVSAGRAWCCSPESVSVRPASSTASLS